MAKTQKIKYSKTVGKSTSQFKLSNTILQSESSVPNLRKEVQRVFHAANRRIQNIENSGLYSPAVAALHLDENANGFAKFSLSGKSWNEIKIEYARAVEFMKKPTSTASGVRTWQKEIQRQNNYSEYDMKMINAKLTGANINTESNFYIEQLLTNYKGALNDFENAAADISAQLETAAMKTENTIGLYDELEKDLAEGYMDISANDMEYILGGLKDLE